MKVALITNYWGRGGGDGFREHSVNRLYACEIDIDARTSFYLDLTPR